MLDHDAQHHRERIRNILKVNKDPRLAEQIFNEKLNLLQKNLLLSVPANFICVSLVFLSLYRLTPSLITLIWYLAVISISIFRLYAYYSYLRGKPPRESLVLFMIGTVGSALLWGICTLFLMPQDNLFAQMIIIVVIAGISSGGLQTLMANYYASILYLTCIILPLSIWLFLQDDISYYIMGFATILYLIFMISTAKRGYKSLDESLHLRYENIELVKILREQSIRDPLTQLFNRRFLLETIPRELRRLIHEKRFLCVSMIDIDYFKNINDTYGHEAGDEVLKFIGNILQENFRGSDIACRFGGEEFVLVTVDANLLHTMKRLKETCEKIKQTTLYFHRNALPQITISIGVAESETHGSTIEELISSADKALYYAKRMGRDRIEIYDSMKVNY